MTWVEHHRRDQALRTVVELADRRRDGLLPWDEIADAPELFGTPADLLAALQMRWYTRLSGSIDTVLAEEPGDHAAGCRARVAVRRRRPARAARRSSTPTSTTRSSPPGDARSWP